MSWLSSVFDIAWVFSNECCPTVVVVRHRKVAAINDEKDEASGVIPSPLDRSTSRCGFAVSWQAGFEIFAGHGTLLL